MPLGLLVLKAVNILIIGPLKQHISPYIFSKEGFREAVAVLTRLKFFQG